MSEAMLWLGRILSVLPQFVRLWESTRESETAQLEAQLEIVRAIKDQRARESIGAP